MKTKVKVAPAFTEAELQILHFAIAQLAWIPTDDAGVIRDVSKKLDAFFEGDRTHLDRKVR